MANILFWTIVHVTTATWNPFHQIQRTLSGIFRSRSDLSKITVSTTLLPEEFLKAFKLPKPIKMQDSVTDNGQSILTGSRSLPSLHEPAFIQRAHSCNDVPCEHDATVHTAQTTDLPGLDLDELDSTTSEGSSGKYDRRKSPLSRVLLDKDEQRRVVFGLRPNLLTLIERTPKGDFMTLQRVIATSFTSAIYEARNKVVFKYQVDCFDVDPDRVHPLLKDFSFLKRLSGLSVAPEAYELSAPVPMPLKRTVKTAFTMDATSRFNCVQQGGLVRFMMLQKVGTSVHIYRSEMPGGIVPFTKAIKHAIDMIDLIRTLHDDGGVVHGDIHGGNICFADGPVSGNPMRIIDFGRASFVATEADELMDQVRTPYTWNDVLHSHWNIRGLRESRRDDVFKTLMIVADFIFGDAFKAGLRSLPIEKQVEFKGSKDFFSIPNYNGPKPWEELGLVPERASRITEHFEVIANVTRTTAIDERPNYEEIINKFHMIDAELREFIQ